MREYWWQIRTNKRRHAHLDFKNSVSKELIYIFSWNSQSMLKVEDQLTKRQYALLLLILLPLFFNSCNSWGEILNAANVFFCIPRSFFFLYEDGFSLNNNTNTNYHWFKTFHVNSRGCNCVLIYFLMFCFRLTEQIQGSAVYRWREAKNTNGVAQAPLVPPSWNANSVSIPDPPISYQQLSSGFSSTLSVFIIY